MKNSGWTMVHKSHGMQPESDGAQGALQQSDPLLVDILASLDPEVLTPIAGSVGDAVRVSEVAVADRADVHAISPSSIVLAVGCSPEEDGAATLLRAAARQQATAIAFRTDHAAPEQLDQLAMRLGIAVLGVPSDGRWEHVASLIRTAMAATRIQVQAEAGIAIGDLFGLADAIASAVGGPVTIEDPHWRVLAYSNLGYDIDHVRRDTILGRTPPAAWRPRIEESGVATALRSSDDVFRFAGRPDEAFVPRLVAPVRAGDELLGSLWVAEADAPLDDVAERELARAAKLATAHLLSHRASDDIKRRTRGAFVREVLEGWAPSRAGLGMLRVSGPFTVMVFSVDGQTHADDAFNPERLLNIVSLHCESQHPDAMCALIEGRVWSVLPGVRPHELGATDRLARRVLARVEASLGVRMRAAIGSTVPGVADIPHSRRAAEQALDVLVRSSGPGQVVHIETVQAQAILLEILDWVSENEELGRGKLQVLLDSDRQRGTGYKETLRVYLDARGDVRGAAKLLSIHRNTLRHRLRRITEISGLDLDNPAERLVTELQLRLP